MEVLDKYLARNLQQKYKTANKTTLEDYPKITEYTLFEPKTIKKNDQKPSRSIKTN